ncbi:MAG: TolC family protein [Gemmatimonadaceae bacterium]
MTHRIRILALVVGLSFAGSGASAQTHAVSALPSAQQRADDRSRPARQTGAEFWRALGDSTLLRLVSETRQASPDVQIAVARADGARAARSVAAFDMTPAITSSAGYTRQRISSASFPGASGAFPDQSMWDAGLRLTWEMDVFGRLRKSLRGQGALYDAADEDVRDVDVSLTAQVASAYLTLRGAQDRLAVARRSAENQRRTLEVTERRLEAGRGTALDTERAKSQLSATLAAIPTLETTIDAARQRIRVITGRNGTDELPALSSAIVLPDSLSLPSSASAVRDRPDVRSAERQLAARTAFVGAARAEYLPRFSIGGAAGYTGNAVERLGNSGTPRYAIGPVISWPALDLGRVRAGVDVARAEETQSKARYELTRLQAREEQETAAVRYRRAKERLRHLEDAATASAKAAELARLRFVEGASDFLPVLDAERTLLERENERAMGRTDAETSLVAVYRAFGGANVLGGEGAR